MICTRVTEGEATEMPCKGEAVLEGLCWNCFWVEKPERRGELPPRVKTVKPRAEQKETPWAKRVFAPFFPWFTRKEWPVGSVLLRRNNCGMFTLPNGRGKMPYGLGKGTADFVGWKSVLVTPEMVNSRVAIFVSIEAKRDGRDLEGRQERWHEVVIENGGISMRAAPETKDAVLEVLTGADK